jgi:hypothetical protein
MTQDYIASNEKTINKWWIGKDVEGSGRGITEGIIPAFTRRDWEKTSNASVRIADLRTEIWTRDFQNMK